MNISLVITLIGADRQGLVNAIAERAAAAGANWLESSMAQLAGRFAGIVRLDIAESEAGKLEASLRGLEVEGLRLTIERGVAQAGGAGLRSLKLELLGHDRPGIVREISSVLARHGASIERMETACESASFSGEPLFRATIDAQLSASASPADLQAALEALANELMVDLKLEAATD